MEKTSVTLPDEILIQIMLHMPLYSLVKCTCASKKLASEIGKKNFRYDYLVQMMKVTPSLLFKDWIFNDVMVHSVYQEDKPSSSSGQQQMRISQRRGCVISNLVRGLVCLQENTNLTVCNPGTKNMVNLPEILARQGATITSFLGSDEALDVFKVLCMTKIEVDQLIEVEHQVLTVGSGTNSWRPIGCMNQHYPVTQGLSKRGFLYYGSRSSSGISLVMSFNVSSEVFTIAEIFEEVNIHSRCNLVNYNGKIALVDDYEFQSNVSESHNDTFIEMWIRNETDVKWSKKRIDIPRWKETVENKKFIFKGTIRTRELVFALDNDSENERMRSLFVLYYDEDTKDLTMFEIKGVDEVDKHIFRTWLDHIDSPLHI